ncbi:hypothetical protein EMIHUDRAFT_467819 [Emiliania huxleyi CCMP1516]|uniref:Uncharacterized protein n=2 Tax=Emiliania huxleyi TaxID=2903 RepID=A0A0D3KCG7_EMIH1|nr:hypothetical protein EMIHUDRAFT_467819 [Emiliania huxleyi CCMP1516]EOD33452.1 hypothetical protein EMIHUDRAFT_467819 [Emiliania huxleyi CCMP1516]|eukprot:XP_005785881.1 hypothetical protein EMIHUDRAFT_467819 [Emiliania huxleyi CCMP1516]
MLAAVLPLLRYAPRVGGRPSLHRSSLHRAVCSSADGGSFAELGVSEPLLAGLQGLGFEAPTEIQRQAWPFVRGGGDVVLLDETGSGKTIAYALPVLQAMLEEREELVAEARRARGEEGRLVLPRVPSQALLLAPNRELVVQVHATVRALLAGLPPSLQLRSSALTEDRGAIRDRYEVEQICAELKRAAKASAAEEGSMAGRDLARARIGLHRVGSDAERQAVRDSARVALIVKWAGLKQFVLVGATMPNAGTKNVHLHVERSWPAAAWVRTGREHHSIGPRLRQFFVRVGEESRAAALRAAVQQGPQGRTLVFANTLAPAEAAEAELQGVRTCAAFHNGVGPEERREHLAAFQQGELPVLVCTGLASRGIDFTDVAHVVQYEMAANAVEYIHRVGRTARAGRSGVATALYTDLSAPLVDALRSASERGDPIDALFSRRRLFRKKFNKAREYELGQRASQAGRQS